MPRIHQNDVLDMLEEDMNNEVRDQYDDDPILNYEDHIWDEYNEPKYDDDPFVDDGSLFEDDNYDRYPEHELDSPWYIGD